MVHLDITETSKVLAVSGGYVSSVGLISYFVKEKLFMSEALIALLIGIVTGPVALNWFNPFEWSDDQQYLTHQITRVVIAIQVLFTGIALPAAYLKTQWMSLATLLGPVMTTAWFISSLLVWGLIPGLTFLESLVIGACVTPTDPVLSNAICKGRFAEKHVPLHVRNIIVAEAGANDGLGFPFLFIGVYLILIHEPTHPWHTVGGAIGEWFYNIVLYQVALACIIGTLIGYVARKLLQFARTRQLIDHESFLSFGVALTFFTLGVVGILGSDDILCCFVVGNSFTWDDWFRLETEDHGFQDVIDQLLNSAIFLYIGAIIPWSDFSKFSMTPWRLVILGILIMLVRRLPWVYLTSRWIPSLKSTRESLFAGYFGPIGVGAVFYVQVALDNLPEDGTREHLRNTLLPTVYFLVLTSVVVHGVTVPLGKGFQRAKTITMTRSSTGRTDGNVVSRLPPPVGALIPGMGSGSNETTSQSNGASSGYGQSGGGAGSELPNKERGIKDRDGVIRFDDGNGVDQNVSRGAGDPSVHGDADTYPPTPTTTTSRDRTSGEALRAGTQSTDEEDDDEVIAQREIREGRSVWREGNRYVSESRSGEDVRVWQARQPAKMAPTTHGRK
ncbi:hypothetical protein IAU60_002981 [Kwoniella sp. DSM 27419]